MADNYLIDFEINQPDIHVEYSVVPTEEIGLPTYRTVIQNGIADINKRLDDIQIQIDKYNEEIDKLTNHADTFDNLVAIGSGVLCGLIDSFCVGEFDFAELKADSNKHVNKFIEKYAKATGWNGQGRLKGAISHLEGKFPVDQDDIWKKAGSGNSLSSDRLHHLEDLAHHPTPIGLLFAIVVSIFRTGVFIGRDGKWKIATIETTPKEIIGKIIPFIISGILLWIIYQAETNHPEKWEKLPKPISKLIKLVAATPGIIPVLRTAHNWFGHLVSDMGGAKSTAGGGMGIPGIFLSMLKEISSIPPINKTELPQIISDWYSKGKFDLRSELAIIEGLGKQAMPVLLNELIVRTFYFVRRLVQEKQLHENWQNVDWRNTLPFNNRTITRMITISSGTFMAMDMADAAIRSGIKSGGEPAAFVTNFILRVNFVGLGRFAVAIWSDSKMGLKKERKENERFALYMQQLNLCNAKLFYKTAEMWVATEDAKKAVNQMQLVAHQSVNDFKKTLALINNMPTIDPTQVEKNNPTLLDEMADIFD